MSFICSKYNWTMKNRFLYPFKDQVFRYARFLISIETPSGEKSCNSGEICRIVPPKCRIVPPKHHAFPLNCRIVPLKYHAFPLIEAAFGVNEAIFLSNTIHLNVIYLKYLLIKLLSYG